MADSVLSQQEAVSIFGIVLEQTHSPGRAMPFTVGAVGRGRGRATVSGGAAGGVGHIHTVTEQLTHQLDIRCLAAACTGTGELKVGLGELGRLHVLIADSILLDGHLIHSIGPVLRFLKLAVQRLHRDGGILGQAHVHTAAAAGAVIGRHLKPVSVLAVHTLGGNSVKADGLNSLFVLVQQDGTNGGVGADQRALVALKTLGGVPFRHIYSGAPLFKL